MNQLDLILRTAYPRARAGLVRILGDFDSAEDALQEAAVRAVATWPKRGVPANPAAWLVRTGRNHFIDNVRKNAQAKNFANLAQDAAVTVAPDPGSLDAAALGDDLLALIFTCCHPALNQEAQIALTLKTVAGLSVAQIARAYLVAPAAMERRLSRAKAKLRDERVPYEVPEPKQLAERLAAVLGVVYLVFNEGYAASHGPNLMQLELVDAAIRMGRILHRIFRDEPEVAGLLALMLLQHSRHRARVDPDGEAVSLDQQNRDLWDARLVIEGRVLVEKTLRRKQPGPYQIQAAIAAVHGVAATPQATDWAQIAVLYQQLEVFLPSPVIILNRAVALARATTPQAGLALLDSLKDAPELRFYHPYHAARGELLLEIGQVKQAKRALETALKFAGSAPVRRFIENKLATC
ncbi:MAG: RNA polymerase sigma factor [Alphaproteobacteria bacterium]